MSSAGAGTNSYTRNVGAVMESAKGTETRKKTFFKFKRMMESTNIGIWGNDLVTGTVVSVTHETTSQKTIATLARGRL